MARPPSTGLATLVSRHRGTVTDLLEQLAGEPIEADVRSQWRGRAPPGNPLELDAGAELLVRAVLLRGRGSGQPYVYAESSIAPSRLPEVVRRRLEETRDPIGRVLGDHHLQVERQSLPGPPAATRAAAAESALLTTASMSRRYRILLETGPAFVVDEWFLQPAADALAGRDQHH